MKEIIIPEKNIRDLNLLDDEVKGDVIFHPVKTIEEVLKIAFPSDGTVRLSREEAEAKLNEYMETEKKREERKDD